MLSLLSLLFALAATASAHDITPRGHAHGHLKRASGARFSNYLAGLGACGWTNSDSEFVVALTAQQWDNGAHCGKEISISWKGKTTNAKIVDECMGCPMGGLDFSQGLFSFFVGQGNNNNVGIIYGDWSFADGSGNGGGSTTTSTKAQPKPTPTSTSTPPPPPTSTHTTTSSTKASTSSAAPTSAAPSSASTLLSASASASVPASIASAVAVPAASGAPQNIMDFSQALLNLNALIVAAQGST
ncbi:RlpA-like double-psi beta-barrel-protein domain-containing protein-containing protein [Mycena belliarum]|uniref:RlpA-like double-psi beta-barrel-protein domain-containing protein-containing protein n=1 Tax=Mycena belliarum TaxID=1033014 RepID=A0AAD6XW36_9AGAR|nr:RlpA-like double-psi beta-barrel-protein domain-containing protein-containing protein [Mycena belliae]